MAHIEEQFGTIEERDGGATVRLGRDLAAIPTAVWNLLIDPAEWPSWLAGRGTITPRVGGAIVLRFGDDDPIVRGQILQVVPPTTLEYSWHEPTHPTSQVCFALRPLAGGRGTHLTLTHRDLVAAEGCNFAAGWHHHLELLSAHLAGRAAPWDWERYKTLLAKYSGATVGHAD